MVGWPTVRYESREVNNMEDFDEEFIDLETLGDEALDDIIGGAAPNFCVTS
ncbi:hypothetical protein [Kitasatospora acidiphila]|uniref:hypothetical protein n=1 Tax=Kitasatospora acidiphila TaxID=2567942 RepID=UPI003C76E242